MDSKRILTCVTIGVAVIWTALMFFWILRDPYKGMSTFEPGADNRPEGTARKADDVVVGEFFMKYDEPLPSGLNGIWNGFRGADRSNIIKSSTSINTTTDYPVLWTATTGEGHASAAIFKGLVYVLDYDETLSSDALRCISLETGKDIWKRWYRVRMKRNHGFSRTIPAVGDGYVITLGPEGHVMCCDPLTGNLKWTLDLKQTFRTEVPFWYAGQCPLVDDGTLVIAPAGEETLLAGIDANSGKVLWTTPNSVSFKMSHSSVMPMTLEGKKTYVYCGVGGVVGVSAEGSDEGKLLWSTTKWQPSVIAPSPLGISSRRVFLVAGYGTGGALLEVTRNGASWSADILEQYKADKGLSAEQQTPILYDGMIISILPKDAGGNREKIVIYKPSDLHTPVWKSANDEKFGLGPYITVNGNLFAFNERGTLYVYKIGKGEMELLRKQEILPDGEDAWGPMAYADGRLILRDAHNIVCIKID
ncbi:MAG: PQQ-like beta-propeller repeat protein [Bacteroidales bacterium]|nr:PQQ-like beta-propeller repeat protein [Bacteroidales bacterium]